MKWNRFLQHRTSSPLWIFVSLVTFAVTLFLNWIEPGGSLRELCQSLWDRFLYTFGDDEYFLSVYGTTVLINGLYWSIGLIYTLMDLFNRPQWIRKYKVQQGTNEPVDTNRLITAIGHVLFNQIVVGIPFAMFMNSSWVKPKSMTSIHKLPDITTTLIHLVVFALVEEVGFYYSHRMLHHPRVYKHIHKKHHQWISPIAITAAYCHPVEHILGNLMPLVLGPLLLSSHVIVSWIWYSIAVFSTLTDHSGYHLPGFRSPEFHDFHHLKFTECYGVLGILDYIHGTDKLFRSSLSYQRHFISFSWEPVRTQFPDAPAKTK